MVVRPRVLVTAILAGAVALSAAAQERVGAPIKVTGEVSLTRGGAVDRLAEADDLFVADLVSVSGRGSSASLGLLSGWVANIPTGSVADLAWAPEPDTIYVARRGILFMSRPPAGELTVVSDVARVDDPSGTTFLFSVAPSGATSVYVEHGSVRFANLAGDAVRVGAGLASTVAAAGAPPSPPAPPPPALVEEAVELGARAALETRPSRLTPPEAYERVRGLREASAAARRSTVVERGAPDSLAPKPTGGASQRAGGLIPAAIAGVGAALILRGILGGEDDYRPSGDDADLDSQIDLR